MKRFLVIGVLFVGSLGHAQENTPDKATAPAPPIVLSSSRKISFGIPNFGTVGRAACDSAGDIFFDIGSAINPAGPFLRVSADGSTHSLYTLPPEAKSAGMAWTVRPDGTFLLLYRSSPSYTLLRFRDDGTVAKSTKLDIPAHVSVERFASLDNGTIYLRGYRETAEKPNMLRPAFAALYDESGSRIRDLSAGLQGQDLSTLSQHPPEGDAIAGDDGRFYVLESKDVLVLNQTGDLQARFPLQKPDQDSLAERIDESEGAISIILATVERVPGTAPTLESRAILLNSETGEPIGDYVFDPRTTGTVLCFNREKGYSLFAMDGIRAAMEIVPLQ